MTGFLAAAAEAYVCGHVLLALALPWAKRLPGSARARLHGAQALLVACVAVPFLVRALPQAAPRFTPVWGRLAESRVDAPQGMPAASPARVAPAKPSPTPAIPWPPDAWAHLAWFLALSGIAWRGVALTRDLRRLRGVLATAVPWRRAGRAGVYLSDAVSVPFAARGPRRAYVVLPLGLVAHPRDARIAVSHESQHHRQGDCLGVYAGEALRALYAWNPAVHAWLGVLGELQEFSCDEALVGRRRFAPHDYGTCLLRVAQEASRAADRHGRRLACAVGMAAADQGSQPNTLLHRRIHMLFRLPTAVPRRPWAALGAAAASFAVATGIAFAARGTLAPAHETTTPGAASRAFADARDPAAQAVAEAELRDAVARLGATSGAVAVVDPATGRVVAFAEAHKDGPDASSPWATRRFAPGSVVKPLVAAAALDAGAIAADQSFDTRAPLTIDGVAFTDHEPFGVVRLADAMAGSSNVAAVQVASRLGLAGTEAAYRAFGLGFAEAAAESDALRAARLGIGQGAWVTVVEVARAFAVLANGGRRADGSRVVSPAAASAMTGILGHVVRSGTGRRAALPQVAVAGKTGTMASARADGRGESMLASFVGYAPAQAPRYVIHAVLEDARADGGGSASGGQAAAPLFRRVAAKLLAD